MKKHLAILVLCILSELSFSLMAQVGQTEIPNALNKNLVIAAKHHAQESVYLQSSKGVYETAEDLWFKGYVLNSQTLMPSVISETLYVQLVEEHSKAIVWQEKYSIENGFVNGHVYIQDSLKSGDYRLEAFTNHSFYNDSQAFKALRKLKIVERISELSNKSSSNKAADLKIQDSIHLGFFPEGGSLISDIQSVVAFKAVDSKGFPVEISGALYENDKNLFPIKSVHDGMGRFVMTPDLTKNYHIKLDSSYSEYTFKLPQIKQNGKALKLIANSEEALIINISQSKTEHKETIYLRIQVRGVVYSIAKTVLETSTTIKIPLQDVPQGIAEVTLFNQDLKPVAERLVYIKQNQKLYIKTILDKGEYFTKAKANLKIKVTDQFGTPVIAHLGLSVYDQIYNNPEDAKTIESHYHLSTQLKGKLHNPSYYFNENNSNRKQALNLVLLTQGWRSYVWNEADLKHTQNTQLIINDTITGKVYAQNPKNNDILAQQYVMAFTADNKNPKSFIDVDTIGRFAILPEYVKQANGGYLYLKLLHDDPTKKLIITVNDPVFEKINQIKKRKEISYPILIRNKDTVNTVQPFIVSKDINKLDEVMLKGKKQRVFRDKYIGHLDSLINIDRRADYLCHKGILNCPNHGATNVKPKEGNWYQQFSGGRLIMVRYSPNIRKTYSEDELLKLFNISGIKGYYPQKVFFEPVYNVEEQIEDFSDYRNTLYWKPDIITDENGEAVVNFYCSDINTRFIGHIEGVSGDGLLGTQNFEFYVRKRD